MGKGTAPSQAAAGTEIQSLLCRGTFVVAVGLAQVSQLLFALFVGPFVGGLLLASYEVIVRGPSFDQSGHVGWIAPDVLGFKAVPVQVTAVDDGDVSGATEISVIDGVGCN